MTEDETFHFSEVENLTKECDQLKHQVESLEAELKAEKKLCAETKVVKGKLLKEEEKTQQLIEELELKKTNINCLKEKIERLQMNLLIQIKNFVHLSLSLPTQLSKEEVHVSKSINAKLEEIMNIPQVSSNINFEDLEWLKSLDWNPENLSTIGSDDQDKMRSALACLIPELQPEDQVLFADVLSIVLKNPN